MDRRPFAAMVVALTAAHERVRRWRQRRRAQGRAHRRDRVDAVREGRVREPVGPARLRARPNGPQIGLALARLPAIRKAIGVLFTNPGRARRLGARLPAGEADEVFPIEIRDVVRPRLVGPARCRRELRRCDASGDLDPFYAVDHDPTTAAAVAPERRRDARRSSPRASANSADLLPYVSTRATGARDMDAIRAAIGDPTISYVGLLVRHVARRAVRRPVPDARAGDGARRRGRSRPAPTPTPTIDQAEELRRRPRRVLRVLPGRLPRARSRTAATRRPRSTTSPARSRRNRSGDRRRGAAHARAGRARHRCRERAVRGQRRLRRPRGRARAGRAAASATRCSR